MLWSSWKTLTTRILIVNAISLQRWLGNPGRTFPTEGQFLHDGVLPVRSTRSVAMLLRGSTCGECPEFSTELSCTDGIQEEVDRRVSVEQ